MSINGLCNILDIYIELLVYIYLGLNLSNLCVCVNKLSLCEERGAGKKKEIERF